MTELYRCTPRQITRFVDDVIHAGLVPFVQSSPGMGKSSLMRKVARDNNLQLIDHRLSTSAPEDLSGLPEFYDTPYGRRARFAPFGDLFPLEGDVPNTRVVKEAEGDTPEVTRQYDGWMLFLDEFNSASKSVQALSLIHI